jgi:hypothetical protein
MEITIWQPTGSEALVDWLVHYTDLSQWKASGNLVIKLLPKSDGDNPKLFFQMPTRIKEILYLDSPDLIISINAVPVLSLEISREAGTGHNAFQRFSRIAAAVENGVAAFYIYPEAAIVRRGQNESWDAINPLIFKTLEEIMKIHDIPAFLYYHPTEYSQSRSTASKTQLSNPKGMLLEKNPMFPGQPDSSDSQMQELFSHVNAILRLGKHNTPSDIGSLGLKEIWARDKRQWMSSQWHTKAVSLNGVQRSGLSMSPITATIEIDTDVLIKHLSKYAGRNLDFGELLPNRKKTIIYNPKKEYRSNGDPYTGCLVALDYLLCRQGKTNEDRGRNLVIAFGEIEIDNGELKISGPARINDFVGPIQSLYNNPRKVLLGLPYDELLGQIPRYMMQVRHGTTYTKNKPSRIYAYFSDAILFEDGALWRQS